jgi:hypothetical protein
MMEGSLPPSIGLLTKLEVLQIGGIPEFKGPTGTIPNELSNLQSLRTFVLEHTLLEFPIPDSIATLPNLTYLCVYRLMLQLFGTSYANIIGATDILETIPEWLDHFQRFLGGNPASASCACSLFLRYQYHFESVVLTLLA